MLGRYTTRITAFAKDIAKGILIGIACGFCTAAYKGKRHAFKTAATLERTNVNARDALGDGDGCEAAATLERTRVNARDALGDGDACERRAVIERIRANDRDALADRDGFDGFFIASPSGGRIIRKRVSLMEPFFC